MNDQYQLQRICVELPFDAVSPDQLGELFTAIADAAYGWEPEHREGWDIDVYTEVIDTQDTRGIP